MHRFRIVAVDLSYAMPEIIAADAWMALSILGRLDCEEADVLQDDVYSFSIRPQENGMWLIFERDYDAELESIQPFG